MEGHFVEPALRPESARHWASVHNDGSHCLLALPGMAGSAACCGPGARAYLVPSLPHQTLFPINSSGNPAQSFLAPKQWQVRFGREGLRECSAGPSGRGFSEGASTSPAYRLRLPAGSWQRAGEGLWFLLHEAGHGGNASSSSARHSRPSAPAAPSARLLPGCLIFSPHSSLHVFAHLFPSISVLSSFCSTRKTIPQGP